MSRLTYLLTYRRDFFVFLLPMQAMHTVSFIYLPVFIVFDEIFRCWVIRQYSRDEIVYTKMLFKRLATIINTLFKGNGSVRLSLAA